jgi:hypothetical protein
MNEPNKSGAVRNEPNDREAVLEEYALARRRGDAGALERLVAAYPQHEDALIAFALREAAVPTLPAARELAAAQLVLTPALKQQALATIWPVAPIAGLLARAQELRLSGPELARAVDLPRDVLVQLDRRLIAAASVPNRLLSRLADVLQTSADSLRLFLAGAPVARVAAYNYAPAPPQSAGTITFAEALAQSALASSEQRAAWDAALHEEGLA